MYFLLKMGIFHCYVCLPEGIGSLDPLLKLSLQAQITINNPGASTLFRFTVYSLQPSFCDHRFCKPCALSICVASIKSKFDEISQRLGLNCLLQHSNAQLFHHFKLLVSNLYLSYSALRHFAHEYYARSPYNAWMIWCRPAALHKVSNKGPAWKSSKQTSLCWDSHSYCITYAYTCVVTDISSHSNLCLCTFSFRDLMSQFQFQSHFDK